MRRRRRPLKSTAAAAVLRGAEAEMLKAADEYDHARAGLGDEFLTAIEQAVVDIADAPLRWPLDPDAEYPALLVAVGPPP